MFGPFKPAPHAEPLPQHQVDDTYSRLRWQVFAGIFFGYAAYYFVRSNFDLAQKGLIEAGMYTKPIWASSARAWAWHTVCPSF